MEWDKKRLLYARACAGLVALIILAGSSVPGHHIPKAFEFTPDKLIHCVEYWVLGTFLFIWGHVEFKRPNSTWLITLLIGSAFGIVDETYQRVIPGRTPDFWDWVLDTVGVILALLTAPLVWKKINSIKKPR